MTQLPLDQAIPRFKQNEERIDRFANGDETSTWATSAGSVVPSLSKFVKDKTTQVNNIVDAFQKATFRFDKRSDAVNAMIPALAQVIALDGYTTAGDGGEALYKRLGAAPNPVKAWHFKSGDGAWWQIVNRVGSPEMLGAKGDGTTNDTVALQAAIDFFDEVTLGAKTYLAHALAGRSNVVLRGLGKGISTIKRIANAPDNNPILYFIGKSGIRVRSLSFDGNRANQTVDASNVLLSGGCYDYHFEDVTFTGNRGMNWAGLQVVDGANGAQGTRSTVYNCAFVYNDGSGAYITRDSLLSFHACNFRYNREGLAFINLSNPPPSAATEQYWSVTDCEFVGMAGSGLSASGYIVEYVNGLPVQGYGKESSRGALIQGNKIRNCAQYGLVYQGTHAVISDNVIEACGSDTTNGGALLNASYVLFSNNIIHANYFYGVDAGGALYGTFTGNTFSFNGGSSGVGGTGLNLGAAANISVVGNKFIQNGAAGSGTNIGIPGYDGGMDPAFELSTSKVLIRGNEFHLGDNTRFAVSCDLGDPANIVLRDNDCFGAGAHTNPFYVAAGQFYRSKNLYWDGALIDITRSAASTVVIPDHAEEITITGAGNVDNIRTYSANAYNGKVRGVRITNPGAGQPPGESFPVTFSGGGGTGAAGVAIVSNSGKVRGVRMTNYGSGYTSAPSVSFASGPGGGLAGGTALIGCNNTDGNYLTVFLANNAVLKSGTGNMVLAGGDFIGNGVRSITLFGRYGGLWHEVGRS